MWKKQTLRFSPSPEGHYLVIILSVTLDQTTAQAKEGRSQAGDWLAGWSQRCNDASILISRCSVPSSPLSTLRSLPDYYSFGVCTQMVMNPWELDATAPDNLNPEVISSMWLNRYFKEKKNLSIDPVCAQSVTLLSSLFEQLFIIAGEKFHLSPFFICILHNLENSSTKSRFGLIHSLYFKVILTSYSINE